MGNVRILLVEDLMICEAVALIVLKECLPDAVVDVARTGREAIKYASKNDYALVLMDIGLPDILGYEAAAKIKEIKPTIPIIAVTSHDAATIQEHCLAAGIKKIITKPLSQKELFEAIKQWMNQPTNKGA